MTTFVYSPIREELFKLSKGSAKQRDVEPVRSEDSVTYNATDSAVSFYQAIVDTRTSESQHGRIDYKDKLSVSHYQQRVFDRISDFHASRLGRTDPTWSDWDILVDTRFCERDELESELFSLDDTVHDFMADGYGYLIDRVNGLVPLVRSARAVSKFLHDVEPADLWSAIGSASGTKLEMLLNLYVTYMFINVLSGGGEKNAVVTFQDKAGDDEVKKLIWDQLPESSTTFSRVGCS